MWRLFICCIAAMPALPGLQAQPMEGKGIFRLLSAYREDPSRDVPAVDPLDPVNVSYTANGRRILDSPAVRILDEPWIFRQDKDTGQLSAIAWNPWPVPTANPQGEFTFQGEERFPLLKMERNPDGAVLLRDGLQVWSPVDLHLGMNTVFSAALAAKSAAEDWAGRLIHWGENDVLEINSHSFVGFNAFYSPSARMLFFGVVPYRLPGETDIKIFETASSWEMAAHEAGHAVQHTLKGNMMPGDFGYKSWGESFCDQVAMWTSLRFKDRRRNLLAETRGDLNGSNSLSAIVEMFSFLVGKGTGVRDAYHDKRVSETEDEVHDRSEVLTGAVFKLFLRVYSQLRQEIGSEDALSTAAHIMGVFAIRASDFTPENQLTLEDAAKSYLKVDKEFFQGRHRTMLVEEFLRREIFHANSERDWMAHEASLPNLRVPRDWPDQRIAEYILANQGSLGIGPDFGLKVQSITRTSDSGLSKLLEQTIVKLQLTQGRGEDATPLKNHGSLVFRADGTLADYHSPLRGDSTQASSDYFAQTQALAAIKDAKQSRLSQLGVPLTLVRRANGQVVAEAHVMRGDGINAYMEVFTAGEPQGRRVEINVPPVSPSKGIRIPDELLK